MITVVPTEPRLGRNVLMCGITRKFALLARLPPVVVSCTGPVVAPAGTVVVIFVDDTGGKPAAVPLKLTLVVPFRFTPGIVTFFPTMPDAGCSPNAIPKLKTVPQLCAQRFVRKPFVVPVVVP